ncbi:MAG: hypothetical protein KAY24_00190 [Candidatus Eisenbacteria sp.]|nr:hypothetical protein [Candidatus Eisenbacteria bacterium]
MSQIAEQLVIVLFLALVNRTLIEFLVAPIKARYPDFPHWWGLVYIVLLTGAGLGWASEANVFAAYLPSILLGRILTAILVGAGTDIINTLFVVVNDKKRGGQGMLTLSNVRNHRR